MPIEIVAYLLIQKETVGGEGIAEIFLILFRQGIGIGYRLLRWPERSP